MGMSISPSWITQRLPRGPEPEPQDLAIRGFICWMANDGARATALNQL